MTPTEQLAYVNSVPWQHREHVNELRWRYVGPHAHLEPFWQCPPCLRNLAANGLTGARTVRLMREWAR